MAAQSNTIGMTDLLDEVSRDLDDFRKKHPGDYSLKNVTLWWELERERLLLRHKEVRVARRIHFARRLWLLAGACLVTFAAGVLSSLSL